MTINTHTAAWLGGILLIVACGDDGNGPANNSIGDSESGFGSEGSNNPSGLATDSSSAETEAFYETLGEGEIRGLMTFTLYPPDSLTNEAVVGFAGAWRYVKSELTDVDDFFGVEQLAINFPPPPEDVDTLEHNGIPLDFDWGAPFEWELAGTAMKLVAGDAEAQACLLYRGGSPVIELPSGSYPNYPVYSATNSVNQPEGCAPQVDWWQPDTEYAVVLYGGDLFETNSLPGQVNTPPALEVSAPDLSTFQLGVPMDSPLEVTWTGDGNIDDRVVIRVWDVFDSMFTILASDDGSYTIAADDLAQLTAGPAIITVARENIELVPFTDGIVKVVTRYEQWGYIDLY